MHAELRDTRVNSSAAKSRARHWTNCPTAPAVVPDLKGLESASALVGHALEQSSTHRVGGHVSVRIVLDLSVLSMCSLEGGTHRYREAHVELRSMVFQVCTQKVRVDGVTHVGGD